MIGTQCSSPASSFIISQEWCLQPHKHLPLLCFCTLTHNILLLGCHFHLYLENSHVSFKLQIKYNIIQMIFSTLLCLVLIVLGNILQLESLSQRGLIICLNICSHTEPREFQGYREFQPSFLSFTASTQGLPYSKCWLYRCLLLYNLLFQ